MRRLFLILLALGLSSCSLFVPKLEKPTLSIVGVQLLKSDLWHQELRVRLRVQNPNDAPLEYNGAYLNLTVLDRSLATGVSDEVGTVPRFGEAVVAIPVTVSVLRVASNAIRMFGGAPIDRVTYRLEGKLNGPMFGATCFQSQGELNLPLGAVP